MFSKIPFRRIVLFAMVVSLVWASTACNRKDNGISPTSITTEAPQLRASFGSGLTSLLFLPDQSYDLPFQEVWNEIGGSQRILKHRSDPFPDLSNVDLLVIGDPYGVLSFTPAEKAIIQQFVASGKGLFYWSNGTEANVSKSNEITELFGVKLALQYVDLYFTYGRDPSTDLMRWFAFHQDPFYWAGVLRNDGATIFWAYSIGFSGYCSFENPSHEIFSGFTGFPFLIFRNISYFSEYPTMEAGVKSGNGDYPPNTPFLGAFKYGNGKVFISGDTNWLTEPFPTSPNHHRFRQNIFAWLTTGPSEKLKITSPVNGSQFTIGENVAFVGEQTGNVAYLEWVDNGSVVFGNSLNANKNDFTVGTHTITLRGRISTGQIITSNPIFLVINPITIEVTLNPTTVRPSQTPTINSPTTPTTVTITVKNGANPVVGHPIRLTAAGVAGSGGHDAANHGDRPIPDVIGNLRFGVFATASGVTDATGLFTTTYTPTRFGGLETITASSQDNPSLQAIATLAVTVSNLVRLPRSDLVYIQIGGTDEHPGPQNVNSPVEPNNNHWGSQGLASGIQELAGDYNDEYENEVVPLLGFNDMSLPNGGLFDISGEWAPQHNEHREGINVDLRVKGLDVYELVDNRRRTFLWDTIIMDFGNEPHEEYRPASPAGIPTSRWHWHLTYTEPML